MKKRDAFSNLFSSSPSKSVKTKKAKHKLKKKKNHKAKPRKLVKKAPKINKKSIKARRKTIKLKKKEEKRKKKSEALKKKQDLIKKKHLEEKRRRDIIIKKQKILALKIIQQKKKRDEAQRNLAKKKALALSKALAKDKKSKAEISKSNISQRANEKFVRTGVEGFDKLFAKGYGLPSGSSILVEGGPGSGKTVFCLASVVGLCKQGKKCLYMSFEEPEERLIEHMEHFGWEARKYVNKGILRIKRFEAIDVSRSVEALLSAAKKELLIDVDPVLFPEDFSPDFVVIDSLTSIASAFSGHESRFRIYMEQLFRYLEKNKITNFLIREVATPTHIGSTFKEEGEAVSFLSDGIIIIYNVIYSNGRRGSAIEILKVRGSNFEKKIVEMHIVDKKGIVINPNKILKESHKSNFTLT